MSSKTDKRAKEILRLLLSHGKTSIEELTVMFGTSAASVRRDLVRLEEQGLVHRTHGGAMLAGQSVYEPFRFDSSFHIREERFVAEKKRIAAAAARLIGENETIGFTAGTTTTQVALSLRNRIGLHIVTNAVNIAMELGASNGNEITLTGGSLRWPGAFSLVGPTTNESLSLVVLDRVFIGVCGIDVERGATTIEAEEAAVFRAFVRRSKQVIVVADSSKIGMSSPAVICPLPDVSVLVTDEGVSKGSVAAFESMGVRVISV